MFVGRSRESSLLRGLLDEARGGQSRVLVVRGEPGVGKTELVQSVVSGASGWRVVRTIGVESEVELGFAALHQLCGRSADGLEQLPAPQREALGAAFGLTEGRAPERFLVGLAVLSLLSSQAEEGPLLCIIDDAQWLDRESAQVLAFVARRLLTDPIVMLFATRQFEDELRGLPELVLEGLTDEEADALLSSVVDGPLNPQLRARIIAETRGNPLALIELPRGLTPADLAVGFGVTDGRPVPKRIEATFARRIERLPPQTQRLLLIAAADPLGQADTVWRAADLLGIGPEAADPAAEAELLEIDETARFRHPLVRSAVYRMAPPSERRIAHQALADATDPETDPDRRAWHRASVLELGLGHYSEALKQGMMVFEVDPWYVCSMNLGDVIEAAVRSDDLSTAQAALSRLGERAQASQTPWALGLLARGRALTASDEDAEVWYLEALEHLARSEVVTDFARTRLLYGEWLRRQRRRREAREQLRAAYETFLNIGAEAFARRAESELLATGEHARARTEETRSELTPQELQVALLAADGQSNVEIAAQLYISPHTVSYHLRKVYTKLGVRSRSHLVKALADAPPV